MKFTKFHMCIDIVEVCFGVAHWQIASIFDWVISPRWWRCIIVSLFITFGVIEPIILITVSDYFENQIPIPLKPMGRVGVGWGKSVCVCVVGGGGGRESYVVSQTTVLCMKGINKIESPIFRSFLCFWQPFRFSLDWRKVWMQWIPF